MCAKIIQFPDRPQLNVISTLSALKRAFMTAGLECPQLNSCFNIRAKDGSESGEYFGFADDLDNIIKLITVRDFAQARQSLQGLSRRFDDAATFWAAEPEKSFSFNPDKPSEKADRLTASAETLRQILIQLQAR